MRNKNLITRWIKNGLDFYSSFKLHFSRWVPLNYSLWMSLDTICRKNYVCTEGWARIQSFRYGSFDECDCWNFFHFFFASCHNSFSNPGERLWHIQTPLIGIWTMSCMYSKCIFQMWNVFKKAILNYMTYQDDYVLDVLWCQPIKLIHVVSTSEFHEYWWNDVDFIFFVPSI